jgi:AcrR family transcriptional regulator
MDTREALLAAAAAEFARHGPKGTRIREIVARSGVNERMIYHHFGSKEGLYRAVFEREGTGVRETWAAALAEAAALEPYAGVQLVYRTFFDMMHSRPLFLSLVTQEASDGWGVRPQVAGDGIPEELRGLYERGIAAGVFRADVDLGMSYVTAIATLVAVPRMAGHVPAVLGNRDMGEIRDQVVKLLLEGVTK